MPCSDVPEGAAQLAHPFRSLLPLEKADTDQQGCLSFPHRAGGVAHFPPAHPWNSVRVSCSHPPLGVGLTWEVRESLSTLESPGEGRGTGQTGINRRYCAGWGRKARVLASLTLSARWSPNIIGTLGMKPCFFSDKHTKACISDQINAGSPKRLTLRSSPVNLKVLTFFKT